MTIATPQIDFPNPDAGARTSPPLRRWDYVLLAAFCLLLFGYAGFSGRPLTMHEARLPETSREMLVTHSWLLPTSGGRPWLERPPLPHWVVTSAMRLFGHDDRVWVVRWPSGLMGLIAVLLTASMAGRVFGRTIGLMSGFVLATCFEFYTYSCLAEDDIYLGALVAIAAALFVKAQYLAAPSRAFRWYDFFTVRRPAVLGFFIVLGLTNLTKGPLLGLVILGTPVGVSLVWESVSRRSLQPILRFAWLWGWLITITLTVAWPMWAYHKYPDVVDNWRYDYLGRVSGAYTDINEAWYYYLPTTATALLPWTPACLIGMLVCVVPGQWWSRFAKSEPSPASTTPSYSPVGQTSTASARRFFLLWAVVPLLVLSVPKGKHHHYLIPLIAPWAILGAIGLREIGRYLSASLGRKILIGFVLLLLVGYSAGQTIVAGGTDHTLADTAFLQRVNGELPGDARLFLNGKLGPKGNLDFFRVQFYSRPTARLLHNLSYLRDEKIADPVVYVITRAKDEAVLRTMGTVVVIDQSPSSHEITKPEGRFTLYKLTFDPTLQRYRVPTYITSLQAMERADGPWCGPRL